MINNNYYLNKFQILYDIHISMKYSNQYHRYADKMKTKAIRTKQIGILLEQLRS